MILVGANLLIYACHTALPQHQAARAWFDGRLNGPAKIGLPWPSLLALRVTEELRRRGRMSADLAPRASGRLEFGDEP